MSKGHCGPEHRDIFLVYKYLIEIVLVFSVRMVDAYGRTDVLRICYEMFPQRSWCYGSTPPTSCKWFARCRLCCLALACSPTQTVWRFWALRDCATLLIASLPDGAYLLRYIHWEAVRRGSSRMDKTCVTFVHSLSSASGSTTPDHWPARQKRQSLL